MGFNDIQLIAAISGDQVKFTQLSSKLQRYGYSLALSLFSDPTLRDDAVEKAMDKTLDWLGSDLPLHSDHPWSYSKRIVANGLFDIAKTRKVEGVSLDARTGYGKVGNTIANYMAWIDEGFAKLDDEEGGNSESGLGWRVFEIIEKQNGRKQEDGLYHMHKWIEGLNQLFRFQWWTAGIGRTK